MAQYTYRFQDRDMSRDLRINYVYMNEITYERFTTACEQLGWANKSLVQQCIHAFFKKHQDYYANAGIQDALARGLTSKDYYEYLWSDRDDDLPHYLGQRPDFGSSPISTTPQVVVRTSNKRNYNVITLGDYNCVLLKVAKIVELETWPGLVSRIMAYHFNLYWESNYLPQIQLHQSRNFKLEE
jgi:hypothetical protein